MDNTFIKNELIERYVLNQLNDEELVTFRGQLMFDENLRKQVVETKMLMSGLAAIAQEGAIASPKTPVTAPAATQSNTMRRAAMVIGVLLLAGMTYYFVSSSDSTDVQEEISTTPIDTPKEKIQTTTPQNNSTEEPTDKEEAEPNEKKEEQIYAKNSKSTPTTTPKGTDKEVVNPEELFSSPSPIAKAATEDEKIDFFEEESISAFAASKKPETVNSYIEDAISNNTTKSRMGVVEINDFENSKVIYIDKNGAVNLNIEGTIDTKAGNNKQYIFKLFDNDEDKFINNMPLDQEHLKPKFFGTDKQPFTISSKIALKPGLYYFTIEEEIDDDQDMIYAGRFYVQAGKFEVKDK